MRIANQSEVRTALTLPATGANGTAIAWSAAPTGIIDPATGSVTRDPDEDKAVTLTATITKGSGTPVQVPFGLTVASSSNELAEVFMDFNDSSTFALSGDNAKLIKATVMDISLNGR